MLTPHQDLPIFLYFIECFIAMSTICRLPLATHKRKLKKVHLVRNGIRTPIRRSPKPLVFHFWISWSSQPHPKFVGLLGFPLANLGVRHCTAGRTWEGHQIALPAELAHLDRSANGYGRMKDVDQKR